MTDSFEDHSLPGPPFIKPSSKPRPYPHPQRPEVSPVGDEIDLRRASNYHLVKAINDGLDPNTHTDLELLAVGYPDWIILVPDDNELPARAVLTHTTHPNLWLLFHALTSDLLLPGRNWSSGTTFRFLDDPDFGNELKLGTPDELVTYVLSQHRDQVWSRAATQAVLTKLPGENAYTEAFIMAMKQP